MSIVFSGSPLDRVSARRRDARWVVERMNAPESRYLPLWRLQTLVRVGSPAGIAWATRDIREVCDEKTGAVLLGVRDEVAHFAVDISGLEKPEQELGLTGTARFADVRAAAAELPGEDAAIVAQARSMIDWHQTHRFCPGCGEETAVAEAGNMRSCEDCDREHFPRTNPVVIMLVSHGERCLLGRQRGWPTGMYSALAGFVEPGETLEEAVRREVAEEAGIRVGAVRYYASQPWPFPASLMIGCLAEAGSEAITVDRHELEDARWFEREVMRRALAGESAGDGCTVPPPMAIAHQLIRAWAEPDAN